MRTLDYILLAVKNPRESAQLYSKLLGCEPVENSDTFVLFVLPSGPKLGLWIESQVEPKPKAAGGVELSFSVQSREAVLRTYEEWTGLGLNVLQAPTQMDFGFTFVVEDPDGTSPEAVRVGRRSALKTPVKTCGYRGLIAATSQCACASNRACAEHCATALAPAD
ncbi:MAG: VOC family protein [Myxococcales bacterium]